MASPDPALTAALQRTSGRSVQVLSRCLLERRSLSECAAFYGICEPAFAALLARSLRELQTEVSPTPAAGAALPAPLASALPSEVTPLAARLWAEGSRALPPPEAEADDTLLTRLLRVVVIAALLASLVYAATALS